MVVRPSVHGRTALGGMDVRPKGVWTYGVGAKDVRPWIFMVGFSLENTDFYSPEIRIYGNESSFLSKDGKYEGLSEVKISYLERTEEGD